MIKKLIKIIAILFVGIIFLIVLSHMYINFSTKDKTFSDIKTVEHNKVGLVLGTSKYISNGSINLYFLYRIQATVELFKNAKIDFVLVSGDNSHKSYNEPIDFKEELIKNGIPEDKIFLDYAGFRTLDSMVRAKTVFGLDSVTVISQRFHNKRAIFLAESHKLHAIGFNAKNVSASYGFKTSLREYLARTKAVFDVLIGVKPKFYGESITIE